jgi:pimeloyl-ACP methyl ester carboxylesterase
MKELPTIIYLHGLGSSPQSPKARLFAGRFTTLGHEVVIPELSLPSLQQLSVRAALERVGSVVADVTKRSSAIVIGSSFGGFLAVHALRCLSASESEQVRGLVLLAPVLYPRHPREPIITQKMEADWQKAGVFPIPEGATGQFVSVHYRFLQELNEYASREAHVTLPTLVVHGVRDEAVPYTHSVEFVEQNAAARLITLQDDHQMMAEPQKLVAVVQEFAEGL